MVPWVSKRPGGHPFELSGRLYRVTIELRHEDVSSVREGECQSQRLKWVGDIDQTGKSSFSLMVRSSFNQSPRFDSQLGHKDLWIYLTLVCLVNITGNGEGDVRSITAVTAFLIGSLYGVKCMIRVQIDWLSTIYWGQIIRVQICNQCLPQLRDRSQTHCM